MATIYEVAELAGVSTATVSRVFNGQGASPESSRRVREAAQKLDFTLNRSARSLRRKNSELIALVIPDIENPFFTALARGVEDRTQEAGYSLVLCNTDEDPAKERRYIDVIASENMAGVILAPSPDQGDVSRLIQRGRPIVAVDRSTNLDIDAVRIDNALAGTMAVEALRTRGHRRIACIGGPAGFHVPDERSNAWRALQENAEAGSTDSYFRHGNYRIDGGREAMRSLLEMSDPPDAVVATNNLMGLGALQVLIAEGIAPPAFGLATIGELPLDLLTPGAVAQVTLPARHLGSVAAKMLLDRIAGDTQPAWTVMLRPELAPD